MKRFLLSTTILAGLAFNPAEARVGVMWDGASTMIAHSDPYNEPPSYVNPTHARWGLIHFRFSSLGQVSDGDTEAFQVMWSNDNYDGPIHVRFSPGNDSTYDGLDCPYLYWDIVNNMGANDDGTLDDEQQSTYNNEHCASRPDPRLFSSGSLTGFVLIVQDANGNWLHAVWTALGQMSYSGGAKPTFDGGQYDVQIYFFTGDLTYPPFAKILVSQRDGDTGVLTDPDYIDASYNYNTIPDGFDVPWSGNFWQMATLSTDTNYRMYWAFTGSIGEWWMMYGESASDLQPFPTLAGSFLNADNSAAFLGLYGQIPVGIPPVVYLTGDPVDFTENQADIGYGAPPQTYTSEGWTMNDPYNNPNFAPYNGIGVHDGADF